MVCSLIAAGLLKGTIGIGMPVVALPLLSLFIDVKSAAMLLSMPLIFSNLPQALEGGRTGRCLMQLLPVLVGMIPGLVLGVRVLLELDAEVAKVIAGLVLVGVGGVTLLSPTLELPSRLIWPAGIAFGEMEKWLIGASLHGCASDASGTWSCEVKRGSANSWIVWNVNGATNFSIPATWGTLHSRTDVLGNTASLQDPTTVSIGISPLSLQ